MFFGRISLEDIGKSMDINNIIKNNQSMYKRGTLPSTHYPYQLEKRLHKAMLECNLDKLSEVVAEFSNYPVPSLCKDNSIRSLKNILICTCTLVTRIVMEAGIDENYAYFLSDLYINKIESLEDEDALMMLNGVMLLDFMEQIRKELIMDKNIESNLILKVVEYMDQHIYDQLSLTQVAAYFDTNSSYLSRAFKKEVGIPFTEYVHNCRIKKAQHLLLLTNMPLIEISTQLGYATQSHFTTVFKKICDMTPKQYRKNHSEIVE